MYRRLPIQAPVGRKKVVVGFVKDFVAALQHRAVINWLLLLFYILKLQNHMPPVMAQTKKMSNKLFFLPSKKGYLYLIQFFFLNFFVRRSYSLNILWPFWVGSELKRVFSFLFWAWKSRAEGFSIISAKFLVCSKFL